MGIDPAPYRCPIHGVETYPHECDACRNLMNEATKMVRARNEKLQGRERLFKVKDSGRREDFDTGAKRDSREGKGRYDLITPEFEQELALVMEGGAVKYGDHNWEKGIPFSRSLDSCLRHIRQWQAGREDENHLAHAVANLMFIITMRARGRADLDDRQKVAVPGGEPSRPEPEEGV